jgi:hypothetical protein
VITAQSSTEVEVVVELVETPFVTIDCAGGIMLSMLAVADPGYDGDYRFFHPLILKVDGAERNLPLELAAGPHAIELLGEKFQGVGLLIVGYGLHAVTSVMIGSSESATAARVAALPKIIEGNGPPPDSLLTGINGSQYLDLLTGFWHKEVAGVWQQQP